jgi:murein DD-endopeptidase MepM/ murein hydrolase activator NlpD
VDGEIITPYSDGEMVKSLTLNDWRTHDGVDIAAEAGTPVKACNSGTVEEISVDPMWGTTVTISHSDGSKSYYMGLNSTVSVTQGQQVALGDVIGSVGDTAVIEQALDSHLHFAMKKDSNWINPISGSNTEK